MLGALANEARLNVFRLLAQAGQAGINAGALADLTGLPASSLSAKLKDLSQAGWVQSKREGRFVIYSARYEALDTFLSYMAESGKSLATPTEKKP